MKVCEHGNEDPRECFWCQREKDKSRNSFTQRAQEIVDNCLEFSPAIVYLAERVLDKPEL